MVFGGVLALLVGQTFGKNTETDAFFVAYGVYTVGLVMAQTFRLAAVSKVVNAPGPRTETVMLGAVAILVLAAGVPMVGLADPTAGLLIASDPTGAGPAALRVLWIALAGQLAGAMLAMFLATRGAFLAQGIAMLSTGVVVLGTFALLQGSLGIAAASISLAATGVWIAIAMFLILWRGGWRPAAITGALVREMVREASTLLFASLTFIGTTAAYVLSQAAASHDGPGEATLYGYAFAIATVLVGLTSNVAAMVRSPSLVASVNRTDEAIAAGELTFRFTALVSSFAITLLVVVGAPALGLVLGYDSEDTRSITLTAACFTGWVVGSAAGVFAVIELLARGQLRSLAGVAAVQVATAGTFAWIGSQIAGIEGIAAGISLSMMLIAGIQLRLAYGPRWVGSARRLLTDLLRSLLVVTIGLLPGVAQIVFGSSTVTVLATGVATATLLVLATRVVWPAEFRTLAGLLRR